MLPPARFSLVTAQSPCAKTSQSLKNIRDCVPGPAGTGLTGKINIDVFLCFLNCLRAVLAVAEAVNDPWECLPAAPGGQGRLWAELSLIPQKPGIVFQGGFGYLFFTLHQPLAGGAWSAHLPFPIQHLGPPPTQPFYLERLFQLFLSPFPEKPLQGSHNSLGTSRALGEPGEAPPHSLGTSRGSLLWGEKGKSIPPQRAMESSCVPGKQRQPCQCQQVTSGNNVGTLPGLPAAPDVICLEK